MTRCAMDAARRTLEQGVQAPSELGEVREVRSPLTMTKRLYDLSNAAKIADGGLATPNHCPMARGELHLIQANLFAHFPAEELTALLAKAAREMNLVAGTSDGAERRHIRRRLAA